MKVAEEINDSNEDLNESPESHERRCPVCGWKDVRRSQFHRWSFDRLLSLFSFVPYRCRTCRKRFYVREFAPETDPDHAPENAHPDDV